MGGVDDFSTETLEYVLSTHGIVEYNGDMEGVGVPIPCYASLFFHICASWAGGRMHGRGQKKTNVVGIKGRRAKGGDSDSDDN